MPQKVIKATRKSMDVLNESLTDHKKYLDSIRAKISALKGRSSNHKISGKKK